MGSRLSNGNHDLRCIKCSRYISPDFVGEFGVRYECSCATAESGMWFLPKDDVLGE